MKTWQELLSQTFSDTPDFGPWTQQIYSAVTALDEATLCVKAGKRADAAGCFRVESWSDALAIFLDYDKYSPNGHLAKPVSVLEDLLDQGRNWDRPGPEGWGPNHKRWASICEAMIEYHMTTGEVFEGIPPSDTKFVEHLEKERCQESSSMLSTYLYGYRDLLLAEILFQDQVQSTYFRSLLPWWVDGHFPCGWEGDWPGGKPRIW